MTKSDQISDLASALVKAQSEIKAAIKDAANPFFHSKYADLASVIEAVRLPLNKAGISFLQPVTSTDRGIAVETILLHSSGQWLSEILVIPVAKHDAQAFGSAITYGRRYGLQSMCGVPAEDDDGNAATKAPQSPPAPAIPRAPVLATQEQKEKFLSMLQPVEEAATQYAVEKGWILPTETLANIGLSNVPKTRMAFEAIMEAIQKRVDGEDQIPGAEVRRATDQGPPEVEKSAEAELENREAWRTFIVPIPPKGVSRAEYLKAPMIIDQLDKKTLFGWWANFEPKPWTGKDGQQHPPSAADIKFRDALDAAGQHYEFSLTKA